MPQAAVLIKLYLCFRDFFVQNPLTVAKNRLVWKILTKPTNDHVAVPSLQLNHETDPIRLLACDQCAAAAAERVKHDAIRDAGVQNRIRQEFHRLHGRMVGVLLGFVELPDRRLFSVGIPLVLSFFLPTEDDWLMPPLVWTAPQNQRLLLPNASAGEIKSRFRERFPEI